MLTSTLSLSRYIIKYIILHNNVTILKSIKYISFKVEDSNILIPNI